MPKFVKASEKVFLRETGGSRKPVKQLLWGDWLNVVEERSDGWSRVTWGGEDYLVRGTDYVDERPLEVVFVDVGQGDGCLLVTPETGDEERVILIDAGEGDNMYRFVGWRFGKLRKRFRFHAAVVTHPDQDHYKGFQPLFGQRLFSFEHVYHNGIGERAGAERFGPSDASGRYLTDLVVSHEDAKALYDDASAHPRMPYPRLLNTALTKGRVGSVSMLSTEHGDRQDGRSWMPGFGPADGRELTIEVLGPVVEPDSQGRPRLRWFGDTPAAAEKDNGKTKNGHSVLLRLSYRGFTLLFGGDLNLSSETFLLRHYGGVAGNAPLSDAVDRARERLRSDVMKSCHHGSSDVTDEFLQAVDPFAFVVSSGDEESHVHPRPDLLGRLGRHGRGNAPLILCTEVLRSTREREDAEQLRDLRRLDAVIEDAATPPAEKERARKARAGIQAKLAKRNVEVYGAITLRTDGRRLAVAFRMESPRPGRGGPKRWQTYWFEHDETEGFVPSAEGPDD